MPLKINQPNLKARGSPIFYITGSVNNTPVKLSLGTEDRDVAKRVFKEKKNKLIATIEAGAYQSGTFGEIVELYKITHSDHRFLEPLVTKWGHQRTNSISSQDVITYAESFKKWKDATKNRQVIRPFMAVCNYGADLNKCQPRKIPLFKEETVTRLAPPANWYPMILEACVVDNKPRVSTLIIYLSLTGTRLGEATQLKWQHVLWDRQAIDVPAELVKNDQPRLVPLPNILFAALVELYADRHLTYRPDLIFGWSNNTGFYKAIKKVCANHGVPYVASHEFGRHAFAERLLNNGASLIDVQKTGGWNTIGILVKKYGHLEKGTNARTAAMGATILAEQIEQRAGNVLEDLRNTSDTPRSRRPQKNNKVPGLKSSLTKFKLLKHKVS